MAQSNYSPAVEELFEKDLILINVRRRLTIEYLADRGDGASPAVAYILALKDNAGPRCSVLAHLPVTTNAIMAVSLRRVLLSRTPRHLGTIAD